jgi:hypothetical protein
MVVKATRDFSEENSYEDDFTIMLIKRETEAVKRVMKNHDRTLRRLAE